MPVELRWKMYFERDEESLNYVCSIIEKCHHVRTHLWRLESRSNLTKLFKGAG